MSLPTLKKQPAIDAVVREALDLLLEPGTVTELRALGKTQGTVSGYFTDCAAMAKAAARLSGKAEGVYFTLNPVNPVLLARASNNVKSYAKHTTSDADILRRRRLPLDFDPKRPAGVSSTDQEHRLALERATECREWLSLMGWPDPVMADSGNGGHLLYSIDLPNDAASSNLIKRVLDALALRFSDGNVELDSKTFNAARIWKLYGTVAAKGDSTPERPHRQAKILQHPVRLEAVTPEQLSALAIPEASPLESPGRSGQALDVAEWLAKFGIDVAQRKPWQGGTCYILRVCPNNAEHNRGEAVVLQFANGGIAAICQHVSCGLSWKSLREQYEPPAAKPKLQSSLVLAAPAGAGEEQQQQHQDSKERKSQASRLVDIGKVSELFHTPEGVAYACLSINDHREVWCTNSKAFRESLVRAFFPQTGLAPRSQAVRDAIATLDSIARFDGEQHDVYVRLAGDDNTIWLDLGDPSWEAVEITAGRLACSQQSADRGSGHPGRLPGARHQPLVSPAPRQRQV